MPNNLQEGRLTQAIMEAKEPLDGRHGAAYAIINGNRYLLFQLKKFEAKVEKTKTEIPRLGTTRMGARSTGAKGTWNATLYYNTDIFRELVALYFNTGEDVRFDLVITNDDPNSDAGEHTVIYKDCLLNGATMSILDITANPLEESISGTFEKMEMPKTFKLLEGMKQNG